MTLTFANAGEVTVVVPVVDGNEPQYATHQPGADPERAEGGHP